MFTLQKDEFTHFTRIWRIFQRFYCQILVKCEHQFDSFLQSLNMKNTITLLLFDKFFLNLCILAVFYNVNTVRLAMWVCVLTNHSCQKLVTFLAFVIWKNPYSHFFLAVFSNCRKISLILVVSKTNTRHFETYFSNFSCMFLNPNHFFHFQFELFWFIRYGKPPGTS